jgi:hypothetical protein
MFRRSGRRFADKNMRRSMISRACADSMGTGHARAPHRRRWRDPFRLLPALLVASALAVAAEAQAPVEPPATVEVHAQPIPAFDVRDPSRRQFGALEFRGGLSLRSSSRNFGGLSALRMLGDGAQFIALTDRAWWLRGRIVYDGNRPLAIADAEMAPMLAANGQPLAKRGWFDTEALAEDGGTLYVAIERVHQIVRFNYAKDGLLARAQPIGVPLELRALPSNRGLEALVFVPKGLPLAGALIGFSERGLDRAGDIAAYLIGGPRPGTFAVKRNGDYDISDAALLPGGDILLLERKFGWSSGLSVRLRRVGGREVKPGAVADGAILFEADLGYEIDNMEGLSVHRGQSGEIVLTLVSDDNFSIIQRTLLLQFTLLEP